MECEWTFRDYETDEEINSALCAMQTEVDGISLVGPSCGYVVRWMAVEPLDAGVRIVVYVERPAFVSSTVLMDGRVIDL